MADMVSPLEETALPGRYGRREAEDDAVGVKLGHRICASLVQITTWPDSLKPVMTALGKLTKLPVGETAPANDDYTVMPIAPGRFLVEAQVTGAEALLRKVVKPEKGAVTGLSHARVAITISGEKAEWVLSKGIAVDFSLAAFPVDTSIVTSHHEIGLTIRRIDEQSFDLYVFTSFARSFWTWLEKAASEVGYEVIR